MQEIKFNEVFVVQISVLIRYACSAQRVLIRHRFDYHDALVDDISLVSFVLAVYLELLVASLSECFHDSRQYL